MLTVKKLGLGRHVLVHEDGTEYVPTPESCFRVRRSMQASGKKQKLRVRRGAILHYRNTHKGWRFVQCRNGETYIVFHIAQLQNFELDLVRSKTPLLPSVQPVRATEGDVVVVIANDQAAVLCLNGVPIEKVNGMRFALFAPHSTMKGEKSYTFDKNTNVVLQHRRAPHRGGRRPAWEIVYISNNNPVRFSVTKFTGAQLVVV